MLFIIRQGYFDVDYHFLELITFGMALLAMVLYSKEEAGVFHESRLLLNTTNCLFKKKSDGYKI